MSKIIYLLGAGASYGKRNENRDLQTPIIEGLPIVNEISGQLEFVHELIKETSFDNHLQETFKKKYSTDIDEAKRILLEWFTWLQNNCSQHATIDTFAKKLWLKGDMDDFAKVEFLLTSFFLILQLKIPFDRRYDTFLANVLDTNLQIPDDIGILTWNYDSQFDLAYSQYYENHSIGKISVKTLPIPFDNDKKSIIKINGTANFYGDNRVELSQYIRDKQPIQKILYKIIDVACSSRRISEGRTSMNFAWRMVFFNDIKEQIKPFVNDTEVIIIIGYTYPFFNREIDRWIFQEMPNLKKIYIQDPNAENIQTSLLSVIQGKEKLIENSKLITTTDSFFIPPEL